MGVILQSQIFVVFRLSFAEVFFQLYLFFDRGRVVGFICFRPGALFEGFDIGFDSIGGFAELVLLLVVLEVQVGQQFVELVHVVRHPFFLFGGFLLPGGQRFQFVHVELSGCGFGFSSFRRLQPSFPVFVVLLCQLFALFPQRLGCGGAIIGRLLCVIRQRNVLCNSCHHAADGQHSQADGAGRERKCCAQCLHCLDDIANKCQELQRRNGCPDTGDRGNNQVDIFNRRRQESCGDACDIGHHGCNLLDAISDLREGFDDASDAVRNPRKYAVILPSLDALSQVVGHPLQLLHGGHHGATGNLAGRRDERALNGAFQSLEGRAKVFVLDLVDLTKGVIGGFARIFHAGQHRQDGLFQIFVLGAKQRHSSLVFLHWVFHRFQRFDDLKKRFLCRVTALGKRLHGRAGFQPEGGKCAGCGFGAILCTDVKLLDGVAHLVDAKYASLRTGNQAVDKLVGGQPQRRILSRVFI